ncbi:hypothetical protein AHAS_Ahas13G0185400 [Arachis hypogaea]
MSGAVTISNIRAEGDKRKTATWQPRRKVAESEPEAPGNEERKQERDKDPYGKGRIKKVKVIVATENLELLQRSIFGGTTKAINFESLKEMIAKNVPNVIQVREMGAYKALLTFDSVRNADDAYTFNMNSLLQLFHRVWRWEESEHSETRRVWLECFGVSLHIWSVNTFRTIGGQWGEVVGCARETEMCSSFTIGRVQIDTCVMDVIQEWVHVTVGTGGFDVLVKEVGHEACNLLCTGKSEDEHSTIQRNSDSKSNGAGGDIIQNSVAGSLHEGIQDEDRLLLVSRDEEEDKGRIIITDTILNEWNNGNVQRNLGEIETYPTLMKDNHFMHELGGRAVMLYEEDSEKTVSGALLGLERESTSATPKKPQLEKYWAKMEHGDRHQRLGPGLQTHKQVAAGQTPCEAGSGRSPEGDAGRGSLAQISTGDECGAIGELPVAGRQAAINREGCGKGGLGDNLGVQMIRAGSVRFQTTGTDADDDAGRQTATNREGRGKGSLGSNLGGQMMSAGSVRLQTTGTEADDDAGSGVDGGEGGSPAAVDQDMYGTTDLKVVRGERRNKIQENSRHGDAVMAYHAKGRHGEQSARPGNGTGSDQTPHNCCGRTGRVICRQLEEEFAETEPDQKGRRNEVEASEKQQTDLEEQMVENRKTWELARESGAILYDEEDDIMAIL